MIPAARALAITAAEADADHVKVKTEMLQLRLMEKKHELVRRAGDRRKAKGRFASS